MRRLGFSLLIALLLAACASPPQKTARSSTSTKATGSTFRTPPGFPNFVDRSVGREEISIQAMSLVGVPYRWGGNTPESGFDCSGLVGYVVSRAASVTLPRTTLDISSRGQSIEPDGIAPGDLIFFNTTGRAHSHVGIYVGKLRFVNAPATGGTVRLDYLTNPYWAKRFDGIRRVAAPKATPVPAPFDAPTWMASAPPAPAASPRSAPVDATLAAPLPHHATTNPPPELAAVVTRTPPAAVVSSPRASNADLIEPPPSSLSAAQAQARALAGSAVTIVNPATPALRPDNAVPVSPLLTTQAPASPGADAFEPPPPAAVATRQALRAQAAEPSTANVQVIRASSIPPRAVSPPPAASTDDPIARFANGNL
ncbi:C40 family peptidase [Paraburkholderia bonniea]|uniref:C40 family peptidase n=1 Tax=Paraburkholderia bonniea TaxID=2152891 RepID=UPI0012921EDD|nr:C40 family peptidase [Paraburkholderia bonniea]